MFIVLEGIDGSGTSTASMGLARALSERTDKRIIVTAEPTKGPIGSVIRQVLQGVVRLPKPDLLQLYVADRSWHLEHTIKPNLNSGAIVISDRYAYSTWCYQQLIHDIHLVEHLIELGRPEIPDLLFIFDAPVDVCLSRKSGPKELFEKQDILKKVRKLYQQIVQGKYSLGNERVFPIDATMSETEVIQSLLSLVQLADETIQL